MRLWEYEGKNVIITTIKGKTFTGMVDEYTSALDNEPNGACIRIGHTEILESEIVTITVV